jgi:para-aminobenzoate synthetase component 1
VASGAPLPPVPWAEAARLPAAMSVIASMDAASSPEALAGVIRNEPGLMVLRSACFEFPQARYSMVLARPLLVMLACGSRCELRHPGRPDEVRYGNPWRLLEQLLERFELLDEIDLPFPTGGAFGFWGYELRRYVEPSLRSMASRDLDLPDLWVGFYDSLTVFDHRLRQVYIISTGMQADGSRSVSARRDAAEWWRRRLETSQSDPLREAPPVLDANIPARPGRPDSVASSLNRGAFCQRVEHAKRFIRAGDIYQVNLAQRLSASLREDPWLHWQKLMAASPAPFAGFLDARDFQLASVSPELFLRISGRHVITRPIKGTRPRAADPTLDAQLTFELQTSSKEISELVMITDLLRNDLGRVCEYGSVQVPDLLRLERFAQVQHLVSTVEGRLRPGVSHLGALEACYPGGSITGAPKIRAMELIDQLEPVARGPYTGCLGYLGFNHESALNILIRTSVITGGKAWYHAGAGIVADSDPAAEYQETLDKAGAFLAAMRSSPHGNEIGVLPPSRACP